ncbi:MAG: hypothetical protein A2202_06250 [Bdellovibrionales bacterium RIFOXYA1_FULL_36_14]|nr:MAG: hypothetical protein A2202_06250 [Bdellovibrionales bacterium RIFOXYA1_FULL_36_14]
MFKYLTFFMMWSLIIGNLSATEVTYELNPSKVSENQNFKLTFTIKTFSELEPFLTFIPINLKILKKEVSKSGESYNVNGKLKIRTNYNIAYTIFSGTHGIKRIEQIKVDAGEGEQSVQSINIEVASKPARPSKIFVEAVVDKEKVYKGEGLNVDYYVYISEEVEAIANGVDIREYPKLNNFIKRYIKKPMFVENVKYDGYMLKRSILYSARIYPQKTGTLKIDAIDISVEYMSYQLGSGRTRVVDRFRSKQLSLEVIDLPNDNKNKNFLGLIGKHQFKLTAKKEKYFVNEPVEVTLEVTGPGELEQLAAPKLFSGSNLEEFEVKADLQELNEQNAKKIFEYVFLARNEMTLPESNLDVSYFLPAENKYEYFSLAIPRLIILGKSNNSMLEVNNVPDQSLHPDDTKQVKQAPVSNLDDWSGLIYPGESSWVSLKLILIIFLGLINIVMLILVFKYWFNQSTNKDDIDLLILKIKNTGINYSDLHKLFSLTEKNNSASHLEDMVKKCDINDESRRYFLQVIEECVRRTYGNYEEFKDINFNKKYFEELKQSIKNGNIKESGSNIK